MNKLKAIFNHNIFKVIIVSIILNVIMQLYVFELGYIYIYIIDNLKTFVFSIIFLSLLIYSLNLFTRKYNISITIISIFIFIIGIVNKLKIEFTGEPVIITDVLLLNIIKDLFKIINESIGIWIILFFVLTILFGFFIFVIIMCSKEYINNKVSGKIENIICIISLALLLLLCIPNYHINNFILNNIYDKNKIVDYNLQSWTNYLYYINNGYLWKIFRKY